MGTSGECGERSSVSLGMEILNLFGFSRSQAHN